MKKTVYINGRFLMQKPTGVNRYAYELCRALYCHYPEMVVICPKQEIKEDYDVSAFRIEYWGNGPSHIWEQLVLPCYFLQKKNFLLLNFTGIGPVCIRNKFMTIHDLGIWIDKTWYSWKYRWLYKTLTPMSVATAKKVLTVSNFSKKEIIRVLGTKENRIEVIYNAIPSAFMPNRIEGDTAKTDNKKYILAVSSIDPRKNFTRLVEAFKRIERKDISLYIVGGKNAIFGTTNMTESTDNIHWLGRVSDEELKECYTKAHAFIYPSLYEGFGIPVIEAMAMGCPVIAADIPVLHEVCGEAALYANPYDVCDMADKISQICDEDALRNRLIATGYERIKRYSWEKSASKLQQIIERI